MLHFRRRDLYNECRQKDRAFIVYHEELHVLYNQLKEKPPLSEFKQRLREHMSPLLRSKLDKIDTEHGGLSLETYVKKAEMYDNDIRKMDKIKNSGKSSLPTKRTQTAPGALPSQVAAFSSSNSKKGKGYRPYSKQRTRTGERQPQDLGPCNHCRGMGHLRDNCPKLATSNNNRQDEQSTRNPKD